MAGGLKVDVVGGSGFIGTRFVRRMLSAGADVRIIDKAVSATYPDLTQVADIRSREALDAAVRKGAVLVHLAAEHRDDVRPRSLYDEVNVEGTRHLAEVAAAKGISRIVFTSSVAVYGFAPVGTGEDGAIAPFNDYGRTKFEAEQILERWQAEAPDTRLLATVRPTVVFGERNRGNVYNLLRQIASGRFVMIGTGANRKSIAYVENVAAFLEHVMHLPPGRHVWNYVDQPDFTMNDLVSRVRRLLGGDGRIGFRLPVPVGIAAGRLFDLAALVSGRKLPISAIRVRKFCADSVYATAVPGTGFVPPVALPDALAATVRHEFVDPATDDILFYSE